MSDLCNLGFETTGLAKVQKCNLIWLHESGWADEIQRYRAVGGHIGGICGGYQMLGETVCDPEGIGGSPGEAAGLKMLPVKTILKPSKQLHRTQAFWGPTDESVIGYEIHHDVTTKTKDCRSLF